MIELKICLLREQIQFTVHAQFLHSCSESIRYKQRVHIFKILKTHLSARDYRYEQTLNLPFITFLMETWNRRLLVYTQTERWKHLWSCKASKPEIWKLFTSERFNYYNAIQGPWKALFPNFAFIFFAFNVSEKDYALEVKLVQIFPLKFTILRFLKNRLKIVLP